MHLSSVIIGFQFQFQFQGLMKAPTHQAYGKKKGQSPVGRLTTLNYLT